MPEKRVNDAVNWFMSELTARIVAESGIPTDRFHLGKMILRSLKDCPNATMQIDGATGESETNGSILEKSVKCAQCFRNFGLKVGDVIVLMAPNHLAVCIPFYAALYTGVTVAGVDRIFRVKELQKTFSLIKPKIIFCQSEKTRDIQVALDKVHLKATIVTFDKGDCYCDFSEFNQKYGDGAPMEAFKPTDFDAENTTASLTTTSGTTGFPKAVEFLHRNFAIALPLIWSQYSTFPTPVQTELITFPLHWMTAVYTFISTVIFQLTRLQSSMHVTQEHAYYLINTYKPNYTLFTPTFFTTLISKETRSMCDFSCFEMICLGGSPTSKALIEDMKSISPNTEVFVIYGMTELTGMAFHADSAHPDSCGKPIGCFQYRIIDIGTSNDINEPNVPGELWVKGPAIFKGYYNNSKATEEAFADDGWFKTGDMFYRDVNWNYYFLERIKMLLKYNDLKISPVEIENVIRQHPAVHDVAVTSVPDLECGDLPVACIVPREGSDVTADEIKDLVTDCLSQSKQLAGGVIFMNSIPVTTSTKVDREKIKEIAQKFHRK